MRPATRDPVGQLAQKGNDRLMTGKLFLIAGLQADHAFAGNAHLLLGQTALLRAADLVFQRLQLQPAGHRQGMLPGQKHFP